jgi:NADH-quinone oxidoreductase subunit I
MIAPANRSFPATALPPAASAFGTSEEVPPRASIRGYFAEIFQAVHSIAVGMSITIKYCFSKTVTIPYPEQKIDFSPRYRGIHEFEAAKCIACDLCAKACPVDCIYIDYTGRGRNVQLNRFAIDYSKCMFCALCTEPCPTACIHMGKLHDLSAYSREDMVVEFLDLDKKNQRTPLPLWMQKGEGIPAWAQAEKTRILAGELASREADIPAAAPVKRK